MKIKPLPLDSRRIQGLTLVEVLVALAILSVLMAATANVAVGSYQSDHQVQQRNQLTQIMMGLGRRVMAQDILVLPASGQTSLSLNATQLQNLGFQNTTQVSAIITVRNPLAVGGTQINQFSVQVCRKTTCVQTNVGY
ncbi:PulJ/GspJ family protein [Deinococcus misasensis]|uniref:PulJ/GspJ family protein n=1 Tax=Deinococcus misasensis TaxID=392413 RepID=UPI00068A178A|nr:type II secretion system protein [Deinococcus misasensis]